MAYERLTIKRNSKNYIKTPVDGIHACLFISNRLGKYEYTTGNAIDRLAELEDKIENGTLVELPCKVGDRVYAIFQDYGNKNDYAFFKEKVDEIRIMKKGIYVCLSCGENFHEERNADQFGVTLFTTKEAAEAKLKKLQEEHK